LKHPISRFLVARSLGAAHYVSFRDIESQLLAQEVGFHGISTVYPDSAYALQWDASAASAPVRDRPVVGLAPMPFPFCDPREYASGHQEVYEEYLRKFAAFAAYLAREHRLEMFGSDAGADASAIEDLRQILKNNHGIDVPPCGPAHTVDELLSRMSAMDYVVTCRFHGVVLAHILNKPIIGIAHHPKVSHLMQALGMGKYCADIRTFDPSHLCMAFAELASNDSKIRQRMAISLEQYRSDVARQFDRLFSPAGVAAEDIPSAVETSAALAK
jgi:polysaccharide pyruvyl transferase WcaK-like protein